LAVALAADVNDWPSHDHDAGGQRFSPLKQITSANAARLQPSDFRLQTSNFPRA
jgi:glucose dehydrogenase